MNLDTFLRPMGRRLYLSICDRYITNHHPRIGLNTQFGTGIGLLIWLTVMPGCFGQNPAPQPNPNPPNETVLVVDPNSPKLPPNGGSNVDPGPARSTNIVQRVEWKAECYDDFDCAGAFGELGSCEFERCVYGSCVVDVVPNLTPCDDDDLCTLNDLCWAGECVADGGIVDCDDGNPCTADFCEPWGGCSYSELTGGCNDGDVCTQNDYCDGGFCMSGFDVCYQTGDCCEGHGGLGCLDPWIESCVCDADSYCCNVAWDEQCAQEVVDFGCDDCGIIVAVPTGECCEPHGGYGCLDPWIESCVCDADPYCCNTAWDEQCAQEVVDFGCDDCGIIVAVPLGDDCCEPHGGYGCQDPWVESCVCDYDPYCCDTAWDETCVDEVTTLDCGICD